MSNKRKTCSFYKALGRSENQKGFGAESKALDALFANSKAVAWIDSFRKATKEEDTLMGVDIVVETKDIGKLFIQIKSSQVQARRYCDRRRRIMASVVVVRPTDRIEVVWNCLEAALSGLRKQILEKRGVLEWEAEI